MQQRPTNQLATEALHLHSRIVQALLAEENRRNELFIRCGDPARIARLDALRLRTADRWRRRWGVAAHIEAGQ